jgi:hypothetical protein
MFGGTLRVAALVAAAALSITLVSGDAFARPGGGGRGGHGGGHGGHAGFNHGGAGFHGGGVHRGVGAYGGVNRGFHGGIDRGVVVRGSGYRVGGRYYGGTWYGTGRRYWNGRWYNYGVGACWLWSPIGYVWVCG